MRFTQRGESRALTMTRKGARLGFRVVRGRATYRWTRVFPSAADAEHVRGCVERAIKLAGYTDVDGEDLKLPPPDPLQKWKDACLDDDDAFIVYGDVLGERGDPRAELIAAQARAEVDDAARPEAARLVQRYSAEIIGGLKKTDGFQDVWWKRGFLESVTLGPDREGEVEFDENFNERRRYPPVDLGASLLRLAVEPSAEFVRSLTLEDHGFPTDEMIAFVVAVAPLGLRRLTLSGGTGDLTSLLDALPRLERLGFRAYRLALAAPVHAPKLQDLFISGSLDSAHFLVESELPSLRRVYITGQSDGVSEGLGERWKMPDDELLYFDSR